MARIGILLTIEIITIIMVIVIVIISIIIILCDSNDVQGCGWFRGAHSQSNR